jgi:hypothetical protein
VFYDWIRIAMLAVGFVSAVHSISLRLHAALSLIIGFIVYSVRLSARRSWAWWLALM